MDKMRFALRYIRISFGVLALLLAVPALITLHLNLMLAAVLSLWVHNMLYSMERLGERVVFFLFNAAILFFTFGRNVIEFLAGNEWAAQYAVSTRMNALLLIALTLLFLFVGAWLVDRAGKIEKRPKEKRKAARDPAEKEAILRWLRRLALCAVLFFFIFLFVSELDKLSFMRGKDYILFYSEYKPRVPGIVVSLGALAPYALCLYLATLPPKKQCLIPLLLYILSAVPVFLVGQRNRLVSNALLVFLYYVLRHVLDKPKGFRWIGKAEKIALILLVPCGLAFLSIYAQYRVGNSAEGGLLGAIVGLFRSQGVTFDVICEILDHMWELPATNLSYTFGPVINYLTTNFVASALFGTAPLPTQSVEFATKGNSMQDTISYLVMGDSYLEGSGLGSSYLAELYVDFGFVGVAIFSILLGAFFLWFTKSFGKNVWGSAFFLIVSMSLFMTPRSSALGWLVPALYIPMLMLFAFLGVLAWFFVRIQKNRGRPAKILPAANGGGASAVEVEHGNTK